MFERPGEIPGQKIVRRHSETGRFSGGGFAGAAFCGDAFDQLIDRDTRQQDTATFYATTFLAPFAVLGVGLFARRRAKKPSKESKS